jgi:hypothetical protein
MRDEITIRISRETAEMMFRIVPTATVLNERACRAVIEFHTVIKQAGCFPDPDPDPDPDPEALADPEEEEPEYADPR